MIIEENPLKSVNNKVENTNIDSSFDEEEQSENE